MAISAGLASLHELQTVYGLIDLYDMLEVITVDSHNRRVMDAEAMRNANLRN